MIELVALFGALLLVFAVLLLRGLTAFPFPRLHAALVPAAPPAGTAELFEQAFAELAALGFVAPRWVLLRRADGGELTHPLRAVLQAPDGGLAWLAPPAAVRSPHRLYVHYSHRLDDGRLAVSQPFDLYFEATQFAELVARSGAEPGFAAQWNAHRAWLATLGAVPRPCGDADILDEAGAFAERQRQALLADGRLRRLSDELAVPKLRFAVALLLAWWRSPKAPADPRPAPAERLALLARLQETVRRRAPPRRTQWTLFAVSVALFVALGALFWGAGIALGILLVVLVHEFGHFAAMRAFGYRNVHVLALPLVGGVAMGEDVAPSATRRAWMSLMGPLPGIVIGWALLLPALLGLWPEALAAPLLTLATLFLLLNYLNVLPVPPLDGAHVLQALLPLRWVRLQTVLLASAALLGGLLAWHFDLKLLALLALLHLLGVPSAWRAQGVARRLARQPEALPAHRGARILHVLRAFERQLGPATQPQQRINQALAAVTQLELRPMGHAARLATGTVYFGLLAGPLLLLVLGGVFGALLPDGGAWSAESEAAAEAAYRERAEVERTLQAQARSLPLPQLLQGGDAGATVPAPAAEAALAAAEARLGGALPDELRALYAQADGAPALALQPIDAVVPAARLLDDVFGAEGGPLFVPRPGDDAAFAEIPLRDARGWWHLGGYDQAPLFYLPRPDPRLPGQRVLRYDFEAPAGYATLRDWLEASWVEATLAERDERALAARLQAQREAWRDAPVGELLDTFPRPGLLARWLSDGPDWPDGASDAALAAAEARLALRLPPDYAELLRRHDGFPPLQLLPAAELARWREQRARFDDASVQLLFGSGPVLTADDGGVTLAQLSEAMVAECVLVAALRLPEAAQRERLHPQLVWCPQADPAQRWIELHSRRAHADFRHWLIGRSAPLAVALRGEG